MKTPPVPPVRRAALTVRDLMVYLSISRSTIYRMIENGELKPVKVGGRTLFRLSDIDEMMERLTAEQNPPKL